MSSAYVPGGRTGNRSCPLSFVVIVAGPPINAGEVTRTTAPGRTAPCSSLTVPTSAPVRTWASVGSGANRNAAARSTAKQGRITHLRWLPAGTEDGGFYRATALVGRKKLSTRFFATLRPSCAPFMSEWRKCIPPNTRASTISFSMSLNLSYVRTDGDTGAGGLMVSMRIGVSPPKNARIVSYTAYDTQVCWAGYSG